MLEIAKHTFLNKIRNKELLMKILLIFSCVVFAFFIPLIAKTEYIFSNVFKLIYEQSTTMLSLILAFIISPSIIEGYEKKEINWYIKHNKKIENYLFGKFLYFFISILTILIVIFLVLSVFIGLFFGKNVPIIPTLSLILPIITFSIAMFIFISSIAKNKAFAVILSVAWCFFLMLLNIFLPIVKGYIAPYDINSVQYKVFLEVLQNTSKLNAEFFIAVLLPLVYSVILLYLALLALKKRCK